MSEQLPEIETCPTVWCKRFIPPTVVRQISVPQVKCATCGMRGPYGRDDADAIKQWNELATAGHRLTLSEAELARELAVKQLRRSGGK